MRTPLIIAAVVLAGAIAAIPATAIPADADAVTEAPHIAVLEGSCGDATHAYFHFYPVGFNQPYSALRYTLQSSDTRVGDPALITLFNGGDSDESAMAVTVRADARGAAALTLTVSDGTHQAALPIGLRVGDDSMTGTDGSDIIIGGNGPNTLRGLSGPDVLCGNGAPDTIDGGDGNDDIYGGPGDDHLIGGNGTDEIYGEDGDDLVDGPSDLGDAIRPGAGSNTVNAGDGNDFIDTYGSTGRQRIRSGGGQDSINLGGLNSIAYGGAGNDTLSAYCRNCTIDGGDGNDELVANGQHITMRGGAGDDQFTNWPHPQPVPDTATGGPGADRFQLQPVDHITDFNPTEGDSRP